MPGNSQPRGIAAALTGHRQARRIVVAPTGSRQARGIAAVPTGNRTVAAEARIASATEAFPVAVVPHAEAGLSAAAPAATVEKVREPAVHEDPRVWAPEAVEAAPGAAAGGGGSKP